MIGALQLVELLLAKGSGDYKASFRREGVLHEIEILGARPLPPKTKDKDQSKENEGTPVPDNDAANTSANPDAKQKRFRWKDEELLELAPLLPLFRVYAADGRVEEFMTLAASRYFAKFPEQDKPTPTYEKTRTDKGKISKTRPDGVEKPRREVSRVFVASKACSMLILL